MIAPVRGDELRAREQRALNAITLEERLSHAPEEPVDFRCECGDLRCTARIRLTPSALATFLHSFRGFVVAPGHQFPADRVHDRVDQMSDSSFPASDPPAAWTWEPSTTSCSG
jgi:hypothetical protein